MIVFFPGEDEKLAHDFIWASLTRTDYCNVAFEAFGCGVRKLHEPTLYFPGPRRVSEISRLTSCLQAHDLSSRLTLLSRRRQSFT